MTATDPEGPKEPTPAILTPPALGTFHVSVEDCPCTMEAGTAEKDEPAAVGQDVTLTPACSVMSGQPAAPRAVKV